MVPGRSSVVLQTWLNAHQAELPYGPPEHVCIDGFTGYATATSKALPQAAQVMGPFHVVRLAADQTIPHPAAHPAGGSRPPGLHRRAPLRRQAGAADQVLAARWPGG